MDKVDEDCGSSHLGPPVTSVPPTFLSGEIIGEGKPVRCSSKSTGWFIGDPHQFLHTTRKELLALGLRKSFPEGKREERIFTSSGVLFESLNEREKLGVVR